MIYHRFFEATAEPDIRDLTNRLATWMVKYHPYWSNIKGMTAANYLHDCRAFSVFELVADIRYSIEASEKGPAEWEEYVRECCYDAADWSEEDLKKPVVDIIATPIPGVGVELGKQLIQDITAADNYSGDEDF